MRGLLGVVAIASVTLGAISPDPASALRVFPYAPAPRAASRPATSVSGPAPASTLATISARARKRRRFQSVLFWLAWDGAKLNRIPWNAVTQVNLFSLATCVTSGQPAADCTGPTSLSRQFNGVGNVGSFVRTVHRHHKLAMLSIGGSTNPDWYYPCNPSDVSAFAQSLVDYMRTKGFDGIDLDIEQDAGTGSPVLTAADLRNCTKAVHDDAKAVKTRRGKVPLLTSDVDPTVDFDIGRIQNRFVDQFNAMSYGVRVRGLPDRSRPWRGSLASRRARSPRVLTSATIPRPRQTVPAARPTRRGSTSPARCCGSARRARPRTPA